MSATSAARRRGRSTRGIGPGQELRLSHHPCREIAMRRSFAVSALAASIVGLGATPALADDGEDPGGGWEPAPEDFYAPMVTEACGETITVRYGDVREVEIRTTEFEGGVVFTEFRGAGTFDVLDAEGTVVIDELDISGVGYEIFKPDGTITNVLYGASILFPFDDPIDRAAFEEAGLPDLAYFEDPAESITVEIKIDPEDGAVQSVEFTDIDAEIVDLCTYFDDGRKDGGGDEDGDKEGEKDGDGEGSDGKEHGSD